MMTTNSFISNMLYNLLILMSRFNEFLMSIFNAFIKKAELLKFSLRQFGHPDFTSGPLNFASPDYSGFAFIEVYIYIARNMPIFNFINILIIKYL